MVRAQLERRGISDPRVLEAMSRVARHRFVPVNQRAFAHDDRPLPIGEGQTISQPYMVALMTQCLKVRGPERVLELGTGSGYQAAILAELAAEVYTVERHAGLSREAQDVLRSLGYGNLHFRVGDGTLGWPEEAPFDRILVTAGMPRVTDVLLDQLNDGGYLVAPVGSRSFQDLTVVERVGSEFREHTAGGCAFVPLVGEYGWEAGNSE
ncbi:MAG: protein-L-isoaspartate(D-aspartate) O-methyltransferase [Candidatus Eisenbacteria sp.]|nr:protein-L-isoaspartate(D-aspartate) O-methyltransferase [Candidatus Eisenbacteria bacterium]